MPNIDETAKRWQEQTSKRVGEAVREYRKVRGFTAIDLADRTKQLGYPVTRVAITKIETNARGGKLDIAELIVLAAALGVPPMLLLYPGYPYFGVEALPDYNAGQLAAARWFSGEQGLSNVPGSDDEFALLAIDLVSTTREQHMMQSVMLFATDPPIVERARDQNEQLGRKAARFWEAIHGTPPPSLPTGGDADA